MSQRITVYFKMDRISHVKLKVIAERENRALSNLVEHICKKELRSYEKENGDIIKKGKE